MVFDLEPKKRKLTNVWEEENGENREAMEDRPLPDSEIQLAEYSQVSCDQRLILDWRRKTEQKTEVVLVFVNLGDSEERWIEKKRA